MRVQHIPIFIVVVATAVLIACSSQALPPMNLTSDGVALKGYDPVAYFTVGEPTKGSEGFEYVWNGAKWRFASAGNMEMFKASPEKYAPQYGGY